MKLNFLIISFEFPPHLGGSGTYARELAVGLASLGQSVIVMTVFHRNESASKVIDDFLSSRYNIQVIRFNSIGKLFYIQMLYKILKNFGVRFYKKFNFIFLADHRATRFGMIFFRNAISKSINVFHGGEIELFYSNPSRLAKIFKIHQKYEFILKYCRANIAVSKDLKFKIIKELPKLDNHIQVVLHGIDEKLFKPLDKLQHKSIRNRYNYTNSDIIIVSASRLIKEKGQDNLISAFSKISSKYPNVKMLIAGEGEYKKSLEQLVFDLHMQDKILFTGKMERNELAQIMGIADVFALVSRRDAEAFGLVFIEANACRVPALGGSVAGVSEAIEDGVSGILTNPYDINEISSKLEILISNPRYRRELSELAYKRFINSFTNKKMAKNTLNILLASK